MYAPFVIERTLGSISKNLHQRNTRHKLKHSRQRGLSNPFKRLWREVFCDYNGAISMIGLILVVGLLGLTVAVGLTICVHPATDSDVNQAYQEILHRDADPDGLKNYRGTPISSVKESLNNSPEKQSLNAQGK